MAEFTTVAKVGDIPRGTGATFPVGDRLIALFHTDEGYHAIDDICPHMGASLGSGHLDGETVTCPWHAWHFRVCDGTWTDNPKLKVDTFEVRVEGDAIQIGQQIICVGRRSQLPEE